MSIDEMISKLQGLRVEMNQARPYIRGNAVVYVQWHGGSEEAVADIQMRGDVLLILVPEEEDRP
jgi:hypothetical protein